MSLFKRHYIYIGALFVMFVLVQNIQRPGLAQHKVLSAPPGDTSLFDFNFGEGKLYSRAILLWMQTFDSQRGEITQFDELDYDAIISWLEISQDLDLQSQYPLLTALNIFADIKDKTKLRKILTFVEQEFKKNPEQNWRWQANAVMVAKYRLKDRKYALKLSENLVALTKNIQIPAYARDMQWLILEDIGELEASVAIVKSLLYSGKISDVRELNFLTGKLKALEAGRRK